jgi:hypothetical protein
MDGWTILNWSAWVASAVIAAVILIDLIRVEKRGK